MAEEERRKSDQRFRIAQEMSPDGFTIFKPVKDDQNRVIDFIWVYQNAAMAKMNGTDPHEVVGQRFLKLFPGAQETHLMQIYKQVAESGTPITFEDVYAGETMIAKAWFRIVVVPMEENIVILAHNITEPKKAQQALKESEERLRYILKYNPNAIAVFDYNMNTLIVSDRYLNDYNVTDKDIIGKNLYEVFPEIPEKWRKVHQRALKGEVLKNDDDYFIRPDGSTTYSRWECRPWYDVNGNVAGMIAYTEVITDRKIAESAMRESEKKYKTLFNGASDAILVADAETGETVDANERAEILLDRRRDEIIGMHQSKLVSTDEEQKAYSEFREIVSLSSEKRFKEFHVQQRNGTMVPIEISSSMVELNGKRYVYGTFRDISERKEAERVLRRSLKEKDLLMKELNHRVKNNLLMVSSLVSLKDSQTEVDLSDIQHQIRAISLIHEKLYQTNSVTGIYCMDYFDGLLTSIFSSFTRQRVRIEKSFDDIYLPTKTTLSIGLIINEIATNAIKHGFLEEEEAVFSISMKQDDNQYEITISNSGNPFPEDIDLDGTNTLGLRLISSLVTQLNGTVELKRRPNPVFTIQIPIED
jgi:PAS domain S-box-containing protein